MRETAATKRAYERGREDRRSGVARSATTRMRIVETTAAWLDGWDDEDDQIQAEGD